MMSYQLHPMESIMKSQQYHIIHDQSVYLYYILPYARSFYSTQWDELGA
jgi:hypothetical protein